MPRHSLILMTLMLAAFVGGCTEAAKVRLEADQSRLKRGTAERLVRERVEEFWDAVRWKDWASASTYLEESTDQVRYLREKTGPAANSVAVDAVDIQYIFVDPNGFDVAEVRVGWNQSRPEEGILKPAQATQRWYRHHSQWWLSPDSIFASR